MLIQGLDNNWFSIRSKPCTANPSIHLSVGNSKARKQNDGTVPAGLDVKLLAPSIKFVADADLPRYVRTDGPHPNHSCSA